MPEAVKRRKKKVEEILNRDIVIRRINHRRRVAKHQSPLARLQEIFEESPDKDRFVGDTMFWKYFEDIDPERVKDTTSVEYRNLRIMCFETISYLLLLFVLTIYIYQLQSSVVYEYRTEQLNYWKGCDAGGACQLNEVRDQASFWHWMKNDFIDLAFTGYDVEPPEVAHITTYQEKNNFSITLSPRFTGPTATDVILGTVRMRQVRVEKNQGCWPSKLFGHVYPDCYAAFSPAVEDTTYYGQRFVPTYLKPIFEYSAPNVTRQVPMAGFVSQYPPGGYMMDLPFNRTATRYLLEDLQQWAWVDRATRAVMLEVTVLNTNVNTICNNRILFEFGPAGSVITTHNAQASLVLFFTPTMSSREGVAVMLMTVTCTLAFMCYSGFMFWLMYKTAHNFLGDHLFEWMRNSSTREIISVLGRTAYHYAEYGWNMVDLMILLLFYCHIGFRLRVFIEVAVQEEMSPGLIGHPEMFMPFSRALTSFEWSVFTLSFLGMFSWVKLFKYLCLSSHFRILVRILERCGYALLNFSTLLLVIFFGFSVAFYVGYGATEQNYSTLPGAFLILFFNLVDGYRINTDWFEPGKLAFMPIMFFCYIAIVYFVLLNVFLAIVLDVYATSKGLIQNEFAGKTNPMWVFLENYYNWTVEGVNLKDRDREDVHLDHLPEDLLAIKLELLPGIVRRKWIEKKLKMQRVATENFGNLELFPPGEAPILEDQPESTADWMMPSSKGVIRKMYVSAEEKPPHFYHIPQATLKQEISADQLQRLMDEDDTLPLLLGTTVAVRVIDKFKRRGEDNETMSQSDNFTVANVALALNAQRQGRLQDRAFRDEAVKNLQSDAYSKLDVLEKMRPDQEVPKIPVVEKMVEEMSHALTDMRNAFRLQLTNIIEAIASLFEHLVFLTQRIEEVRGNHEVLIDVYQKRKNGGVVRRKMDTFGSTIS